MKTTACFFPLFFIIVCLSFNHAFIYSAKSIDIYKGKVHLSGAVGSFQTSGVLECVMKCSESDECVSYFYNTKTDKCILHSIHFKFKASETTEEGWTYYLARDAFGRCPYPYLYYRRLDFCYNTYETQRLDHDLLKTRCSNGSASLAAIESPEKGNYFSHILANSDSRRVALDGKRTGSETFVLSDGTPLTYFNWAPKQPTGYPCIALGIWTFKMYDITCVHNRPGIFVCQK